MNRQLRDHGLHCLAYTVKQRERESESERRAERIRESSRLKCLSCRFYEILRFVQTAPSDAEGTQQKTAQ